MISHHRLFKMDVNWFTSCGGTSNETVLKSTFLYESMHGIMKKRPGPLAPPDLSRPNRKTTALSYSWTTCNNEKYFMRWSQTKMSPYKRQTFIIAVNLRKRNVISRYIFSPFITYFDANTEWEWQCDEDQDEGEDGQENSTHAGSVRFS